MCTRLHVLGINTYVWNAHFLDGEQRFTFWRRESRTKDDHWGRVNEERRTTGRHRKIKKSQEWVFGKISSTFLSSSSLTLYVSSTLFHKSLTNRYEKGRRRWVSTGRKGEQAISGERVRREDRISKEVQTCSSHKWREWSVQVRPLWKEGFQAWYWKWEASDEIRFRRGWK